MTIKELINAELENLSEDDLQEFYQLLKNRNQKQKDNQDELGNLLEKLAQLLFAYSSSTLDISKIKNTFLKARG